jgi:hypothetical protein
VKPAGQVVERRGITFRDKLDRAVVAIPDPAGDVPPRRFAGRRIPEVDALYHAAHHEPRARDW